MSGRQSKECRPTALLAERRNSVSAECTPLLDFAQFKPRIIPKVDDTRKRIEDALHKCFLFKSLDKEQTQIVISAAKEVNYAKGDIIIRQGDPGDHFFMLEEGTCDVWIKESGDKNSRMVKRYSKGDSFGELALLYNAPRAATIKALSDCVLWAVDRNTFQTIVMSTTMVKRDLYEQFLQDVPLLETLDRHERSAIADVLVDEYFVKGEDIIVEAEPGDKMYFLENGKAEAICKGKRVMEYSRGDYFGELALLNDQPRAATVTSVTQCKCISIDRDSFKRLLGKVEDILNRNKNLYQTFRDDDDEKEKDDITEEEDKKQETSINDADNKDKKHETSGSDGTDKEDDKHHV
ncbi:hypothetical protein SUGI_0579950 [Cryptomeria japonica]|uniref:uncharacterized protein LOC131069429 n=1 Tax=Cryptomeria japonica TaxID=3369 RepID=UPI00241474FD|nr:uncharacterized protein LOC131069429 [Cryptomeria japonica]GLJ29416.1 hypothetical protein SUGI_0579950 [Cryptomeria japonica]